MLDILSLVSWVWVSKLFFFIVCTDDSMLFRSK